MRDDPYRLALRIRFRERLLEHRTQAIRRVGDRLSPIVGEGNHFVRLAQILHQTLVRIGDQSRGLDVGDRYVQVGQAAGGEREIVHPHRVIARLERAAHDPGQDHDDGLRRDRPFPVILGSDL